MSSSAAENTELDPSEALLRPNTFWELIEKLLLNTTRDEQSRQRHNVALSALCRGHALSRLPRQSKSKPTKKFTPTVRSGGKLAVPNSSKKKRNGVIKVEISTGDSEKRKKESNRSKSVAETEIVSDAKVAKSECQLNDLDIVYLKDTPVNESEILWRYAMKNKKNCIANEPEENIFEKKPIPSIRSNEAIYFELCRRKDEAMQEKNKDEPQAKTIQRRHSCEHIQKIQSGMHVIDDAKVKCAPSFSFPQDAMPQMHRAYIRPARSVPSMQQSISSLDPRLRQSQSREGMLSPWGQDSGWPDLTKLAAVRSKEKFDSKKALYNNVIKRRLNCGSQLDSLNKEILSKRHCSSHTVLNKETTKKYSELKNEYLNLCYQESSLRHQIAMLHAEIYMMQNKGYHKRPAAIKTITLDTSTTPLQRKPGDPFQESHVVDDGMIPLFPSLKPPKPLVTSSQKFGVEKTLDPWKRRKGSAPRTSGSEEESNKSCMKAGLLPTIPGYDDSAIGVCSIYSITPQMITPPRQVFIYSTTCMKIDVNN